MDLNTNVSRIMPGPHERVQGLFVREKGSGPGGGGPFQRKAAPAERKP